MMKSARLQVIFQRVCGRCEQIYAKTRHFPSELARSRRSFRCAISPARRDTVTRQAKCWLCIYARSKCGWYRGKL